MAGASGSVPPPTANGASSRSAAASPKKAAPQPQAKPKPDHAASRNSNRKEKALANKGKQAATSAIAAGVDSIGKAAGKTADLRYTPIVQGRASSLPVVFTKDSDYFCVASSSSVKIHSRTTGEVVSTLSSLDPTDARRIDARSLAHTNTITGLMLHPHNPLQMITASLDGTIKVWDYLDAIILKNIDVGYPITHLAAHPTIKDSVFVAVSKPKHNPNSSTKPDPYSFTGRTNSIIYSVSFAVTGKRSAGGGVIARRPRELLRLGKTKEAAGLQVSPDGKWLVAIGNRKVQIASTSALREGFIKFVSDERLVSLAFHPTEPSFATGDAVGKIRIWYCLDEKYIAQSQQAGAEKHAPSTLLHWHAHAVESLAYTPNGAYLLSGGEEAVLVLWQLSSKSREYVPRLGAPINSIAIADGTDGREQEFVLALADGSVTFVGALNLKATRSFARVKIDSSRHLLPASRLFSIPSPLAVEPCTGQVVMASGHPSSLQFFDVASDRITSELEVAPSNRVSRPDDTPLEPTRIEKVVFSSLTVNDEGSGPAEWMATLDSRRGGGHLAGDLALKFWRYSTSAARYVLNTRIDKPHAEGVTSMSFSPLSRSEDPASLLFVTAGLDKKVKTWRIASHAARGGRLETYWIPRSVFGYRETVPMKATWSPDGSLLAVAQGPFLTLWEPISNALTMALSCPELKTAKAAEFVGRAGRYMVLASGRTMVLWDLVQGSVKWHKTFDEAVDNIVVVGNGAGWAALRSPSSTAAEGGRSQKSSTVVEVYTPLSSEPVSTHRLPSIGIREAAPLMTRSHAGGEDLFPRFLAVTDTFEVLDIGTPSISEGAVAGPSSSQTGSTAQSLRSVTIKRRTLFDDLFGSTADALLEEQQEQQRMQVQAQATAQRSKPGKDIFALFDAPPHLLPPVKLLFDSFVPMVLPPRRPQEDSGAAKVEEAGLVATAGGEDEDQDMAGTVAEPDVGAGASRPALLQARTTEQDEEEMSFLTDLFSKQLTTRRSEATITKSKGSTGTSGSQQKKSAAASAASAASPASTPKSNGHKEASGTPRSVSSSTRKASQTSTGGGSPAASGTPTRSAAAKKRKSLS